VLVAMSSTMPATALMQKALIPHKPIRSNYGYADPAEPYRLSARRSRHLTHHDTFLSGSDRRRPALHDEMAGFALEFQPFRHACAGPSPWRPVLGARPTPVPRLLTVRSARSS